MFRYRLEPPPEGRLLACLPQQGSGQFDELGGPLEVGALQGVCDRVRSVAVALVPRAGPAMKLGNDVGLLVEQPGVEHVTEKVVVAVPGAVIVQGDEEQVRPVERLQCRLAVTAAVDGVAERARQSVEDEVCKRKSRIAWGWRSSTSSAR